MRKKVLITGGAKGLGREIARQFARNSYDLVVTYLNSEIEAQELKESFEHDYSINVDLYKLDLMIEEDIRTFFSSLDRLDVLINNAAYNDDCDLFLKSSDDFIKTLKTNLVGPYLTSKYAKDLLLESNGNIVNIASTNGIDTMYPESIDYDASKAGLINLTKNLASVYAPRVRVNVVAPGWIDTHNTSDMNPEFRMSEESKILLGRFATVEEIARVIYFVASDDASYMTGNVIRVDGGVK